MTVRVRPLAERARWLVVVVILLASCTDAPPPSPTASPNPGIQSAIEVRARPGLPSDPDYVLDVENAHGSVASRRGTDEERDHGQHAWAEDREQSCDRGEQQGGEYVRQHCARVTRP